MNNAVGKALTRLYSVRQSAARLLALSETPAPDARAEALARDGVVVMPALLPAADVARIRAANAEWFDFDNPGELVYSPDGKALIDAGGAKRADIERYYFLHVKNYQRKFNVYQEIVPLVDPILRAYYRSRYAVRDVYCYRNQPIPAVQGSYAWHQDNYPPGSLKVMVYLTPVQSAADGPLTVALGSQRGFYPELGKIGDRHEDGAVRAKHTAFDCVGPAGTVIVFNNNAIHRATDPTRGYREAINFTVFPSLTGAEPWNVKGLDLKEEQTWLKKYTR